jgi:hypothetical protein
VRDRTRQISSLSIFVGAHNGQDTATKIDVRRHRGEGVVVRVVLVDLEEKALAE